MSNQQDLEKAYLDKLLGDPNNSNKALVWSVYLEEVEKWKNKLNTLNSYRNTLVEKANKQDTDMVIKRNHLVKAQNDLSYNSIWKSIVNFFGIGDSNQRKVKKLIKEISVLSEKMNTLNIEFDVISDEYEMVSANPPDTTQYELAMIDNSLFKSR